MASKANAVAKELSRRDVRELCREFFDLRESYHEQSQPLRKLFEKRMDQIHNQVGADAIDEYADVQYLDKRTKKLEERNEELYDRLSELKEIVVSLGAAGAAAFVCAVAITLLTR